MSLTQRILIAMLAGLVLGGVFNILLGLDSLPAALRSFIEQGLVMGLFDTAGQIFVRSLRLLVVPLVFVSLVLGTASLGKNSRMGLMAVSYTHLTLPTILLV